MGHHRVLGRTTDFITGKEIIDTDDERIRQKIARFLVAKKGFSKEEIEPKVEIELCCGGEKATAVLDFAIKIKGKIMMVIKYGPGSIVSRHRSTIAYARLVSPYEVPIAVITNGIDADILDTETGSVIDTGIENIPSRRSLIQLISNRTIRNIEEHKREVEKRILFVYEALEHSSECDDEFCIVRLSEESNSI
ncbi:MAG: hypothetical protein D6828_00655 [Nitrospirae bacterium]|nr:MAG: hypothetical protein D6828_00655 [Nitrospirota bacterium]